MHYMEDDIESSADGESSETSRFPELDSVSIEVYKIKIIWTIRRIILIGAFSFYLIGVAMFLFWTSSLPFATIFLANLTACFVINFVYLIIESWFLTKSIEDIEERRTERYKIFSEFSERISQLIGLVIALGVTIMEDFGYYFFAFIPMLIGFICNFGIFMIILDRKNECQTFTSIVKLSLFPG